MIYVFKAHDTNTHKIEANNIEQARHEFLLQHVAINKKCVHVWQWPKHKGALNYECVECGRVKQ